MAAEITRGATVIRKADWKAGRTTRIGTVTGVYQPSRGAGRNWRGPRARVRWLHTRSGGKGWMPGANWWRLLSDIDLKRHTPTGGWMAIHEYNPPRDEA